MTHIKLQSMVNLLFTDFLSLFEMRRDIYLKYPSKIKSVIKMNTFPSFM